MIDYTKHIEVISTIKKRLNEINGRLISLMISGAHLYGFESADSDIDYRGIFMADTNSFLGLKRIDNVIEIKELKEKDIVLSEIGKEIGLCLSGNCNAFEHINAEQIVTTTDFLKLKQLLNNAMGKTGLYNSYKGMATFNYRKFIKTGRNTVKKYLYVYRGLMAGIHVLQTGKIEPNIEELNKYFKLPEVKQLIELKKNGKENEYIPTDIDKGQFEERINFLFERIDDAFMKSRMPEKPSEEEIKSVEEFLIQIRKFYLFPKIHVRVGDDE